MTYYFEVAADSIQSALTAETAGANRIELCAALSIGGITPSFAMLQTAIERLAIPVHVIIRPRAGDFLYSAAEFAIMRRDIELAKSAGAQGVVFGILRADGTIDTERTETLIAAARPLAVTFHRAFDMCRAPHTALDELIRLQVDTLLTSGQAATAEAGLPLIAELVEQAAGRIHIMPGSGINPANIRRIAQHSRAAHFHFSARQNVPSPMQYRRPHLSMGSSSDSEYQRTCASAETIRDIINQLNNLT